MNVFVLGGGSNVLFSDSDLGWSGDQGRDERSWQILVRGGFGSGAGVALHSAVECARDHGYGGIERLAGIPGTIGGGAAMPEHSERNSVGGNLGLARSTAIHWKFERIRRMRANFLIE